MSKIKENSFDGAPGGNSGTLNYQTGYGTFASPEASQNPDNFDSNHHNKAVNQQGNTAKNAPDPSAIEQGLKDIYGKKNKPTPDEFKAGFDYEMGQMIKKSPREAKETILQNLRKDPQYYSKLKMLNIDDESMMDGVGNDSHTDKRGTMTENRHPNDRPATIKVVAKAEETKKIFEEMANANNNKFVVNSYIVDAMRETMEDKRKRRM